MKNAARAILVCLSVVFTLAFFSSKVFGDGGGWTGAPTTGEPPKGLAISSDAPGAKLVGELFTEHWYYQKGTVGDDPSSYAAVFRAAIRLRSGNVLETYFLDMNCADRVDGCSEDPSNPNCLLQPICENSITLPSNEPFNCLEQIGLACYDTSAIARVQQSLMIWWANQAGFCAFLGKLNTKCGKITLKSLKEYAPVIAKDPSGLIDTKIHLSDIELAVK